MLGCFFFHFVGILPELCFFVGRRCLVLLGGGLGLFVFILYKSWISSKMILINLFILSCL